MQNHPRKTFQKSGSINRYLNNFKSEDLPEVDSDDDIEYILSLIDDDNIDGLPKNYLTKIINIELRYFCEYIEYYKSGMTLDKDIIKNCLTILSDIGLYLKMKYTFPDQIFMYFIQTFLLFKNDSLFECLFNKIIIDIIGMIDNDPNVLIPFFESEFFDEFLGLFKNNFQGWEHSLLCKMIKISENNALIFMNHGLLTIIFNNIDNAMKVFRNTDYQEKSDLLSNNMNIFHFNLSLLETIIQQKGVELQKIKEIYSYMLQLLNENVLQGLKTKSPFLRTIQCLFSCVDYLNIEELNNITFLLPEIIKMINSSDSRCLPTVLNIFIKLSEPSRQFIFHEDLLVLLTEAFFHTFLCNIDIIGLLFQFISNVLLYQYDFYDYLLAFPIKNLKLSLFPGSPQMFNFKSFIDFFFFIFDNGSYSLKLSTYRLLYSLTSPILLPKIINYFVQNQVITTLINSLKIVSNQELGSILNIIINVCDYILNNFSEDNQYFSSIIMEIIEMQNEEMFDCDWSDSSIHDRIMLLQEKFKSISSLV